MVKVEPSPPSPGAESTELDQTQESRDSTETLPFRQVKKILPRVIAPLIFFFYIEQVLGIRIRRIRLFLGLPDPDPHVFGPPGSGFVSQIRIRLLPFSHKGVERTEIMLAK